MRNVETGLNYQENFWKARLIWNEKVDKNAGTSIEKPAVAGPTRRGSPEAFMSPALKKDLVAPFSNRLSGAAYGGLHPGVEIFPIGFQSQSPSTLFEGGALVGFTGSGTEIESIGK